MVSAVASQSSPLVMSVQRSERCATVRVCLCAGVCVCVKKRKKKDSLARKSHFNQVCGGYQARK